MMSCCSKRICNGCNLAYKLRQLEGSMDETCPFCRKPAPSTDEVINEQWMKRVEANCPVAICYIGTEKYKEGDYEAAFEYWSRRAAALGDALAHYQISCLYRDGNGVEKDEKKVLHHLEEAAIGGHPGARHDLGSEEETRGRLDRVVKHCVIAAKLGFDKSLESAKSLYRAGLMSKDDFAAALRGHHAAIEATKSPQRDAAANFFGM